MVVYVSWLCLTVVLSFCMFVSLVWCSGVAMLFEGLSALEPLLLLRNHDPLSRLRVRIACTGFTVCKMWFRV